MAHFGPIRGAQQGGDAWHMNYGFYCPGNPAGIGYDQGYSSKSSATAVTRTLPEDTWIQLRMHNKGFRGYFFGGAIPIHEWEIWAWWGGVDHYVDSKLYLGGNYVKWAPIFVEMFESDPNGVCITNFDRVFFDHPAERYVQYSNPIGEPRGKAHYSNECPNTTWAKMNADPKSPYVQDVHNFTRVVSQGATLWDGNK